MTDIPNAWIKPEKLSPMDNSDYSVIHVKAFQSKPNVKSWFEWKRITNSENKRRLGTKLAAINWSFLTGTKDVTDCMSPFYKVVIPIINDTLPFKRIKMRDNDKSWITHEIKDLMNRKDKAHKKGNHGLMQTIQQKLSKAIDRALQKRTNTKMQTTSLKEKWRFLKSCISSNKHHTSTFDTTTAKGINVTF
jgi:hypothetical protein